jgi:hypothetical protein
MNAFPPHASTRARLSLEHCYWASALAALPLLYASPLRLLQKLQREGLVDLLAELGGFVVWIQSWITPTLVWTLVLMWIIRSLRRVRFTRGRIETRSQAAPISVIPEWLLTCALAAVASIVLFVTWERAEFGAPEENSGLDPGYQPESDTVPVFALLMAPAALCLIRPSAAVVLRRLADRALGWFHSGGPPRAAATPAILTPDWATVWSRRFYVHSVCTMLTSGALVMLGPTITFSYHSYVLEDLLSSSRSFAVAAWLQALITVPLAWSIATSRGVGLVWRIVARGSAASRGDRARKLEGSRAVWFLTCGAGALVTAKIVVSNGFYGINAVYDAVLSRQQFLEVAAMAALPMLLQLLAEGVTGDLSRRSSGATG